MTCLAELLHFSFCTVHHGRFFSPPAPAGLTPPPSPEPVQPYYCLGFIFHPHIVYLSDVSFIPPEVWDKLQLTEGAVRSLEGLKGPSGPNGEYVTPPASPPMTPAGGAQSDTAISTRSPWPVVLLDCLFLTSHTSHFGLLDALSTVLRLQPVRTYLFGFAHHVAHEEWEALSRELDGTRLVGDEEEFVERAMALAGEIGEEVKKSRAFVRPAWDGLRLVCETKQDGKVLVEERKAEGRFLPKPWLSNRPTQPVEQEGVKMACCSACK